MRDAMNGRLQLPIALLTSMIVAESWIFQRVCEQLLVGRAWLQAGGLLVTFCFTYIAGHYLARAVLGHKYSYLSTADQLVNYSLECALLYQSYPNAKALAEAATDQALRNELAFCSSQNAQINRIRTSHFDHCIAALMIGVVCLMLTFVSLKLDSVGVRLTIK